jgi:hypothetical protein
MQQNTVEFRGGLTPTKTGSANMKSSESPNIDDKNLDKEKSRPASESSTSAVKPPYSYIALSNYLALHLQSIELIALLSISNDGNSAITAKEINIKWNM